MAITFSQATQQPILQALNGLSGVLAKAKAHAQAKGFDESALTQARLYPDMFNLTRQVQIACDFAKGAVARMSGVTAPVFEETEVSLDDLKARVDRTIAYIQGVDSALIDGQEGREITLVRKGVSSVVDAQSYVLQQALPNLYFHVATAYGLLRHNGVELVKKDFLAAA